MRTTLEVRDLYVGYHADLHILRGVTLSAREAAITAVLGANGTGKSTLLKAICGFLRPARGEILLGGRSLLDVEPHAMVRLGVAYIPQHPGIFPYMTVEENLLIGVWSFRYQRARVRRKLTENYERFPMLRDLRHEPAGRLSGGQQRMVEIGRALMADPKLLLVDEPTAGLAKLVRRDVYATLTRLRAEGRAILLVDQEIREAVKVADHVYVLDLGRNRVDGPAAEFADARTVLWG
ncbi:MAG TPA: ABC transporter ATP-binding protein [Actinomycetes bacterium]|nr:ABC transporter ATP-binding protein [Actinomycetes bacterium]